MLTGGFRSASIMVNAIRGGAVDIVGLGRPFIMQPRDVATLLSLQTDADLSAFRFVDAKLSVGVKDFDAGTSIDSILWIRECLLTFPVIA